MFDHVSKTMIDAIKKEARMELLLDLIEKAKESARISGNDEMSYHTDMKWLNDLEELAGQPKTYNV